MKKILLIIIFISSSYVFAQSKYPPCPSFSKDKIRLIDPKTINSNYCFGEKSFPNGKYVGEFKFVGKNKNDEVMDGQGTYTFTSGSKYVGQFKDDKIQGQGTYTFMNGDKYVGEYKDNKKHGKGTFTYANGKEEKGTFKEGKFVGK